MPIISITQQPEVSSLNTAYKPIVFKVLATENNSSNKPPVVYCDVYIDDVYYKTFSKTINIGINGGSFEYLFDIQDIKELLEYNLPTINGNTIQQMTNTLRKVFVKFRNAYKDNNGFIISEQKAPIQGTSNKKPIPGEGLASNTFYILNSLIQHEEKQDLSELLNSYKTDEWDINTLPLTKRPKNIYLKKTESSFFPIITESLISYYCVEVKYKDGTIANECVIIDELNVNAGLDYSAEIENLPQNFNLMGSIEGKYESFYWEVINDDTNSVIIENIKSLTSKISFNRLGSYTLRLNALNKNGLLFYDEVIYQLVKKPEPVCEELTNISISKTYNSITVGWYSPISVKQGKVLLYNSNNQLISEKEAYIDGNRHSSVTFSGLNENTVYNVKIYRLCSSSWLESSAQTITTNVNNSGGNQPEVQIINACKGVYSSCCFKVKVNGRKNIWYNLSIINQHAYNARLLLTGHDNQEITINASNSEIKVPFRIEINKEADFCLSVFTTPNASSISNTIGYFTVVDSGETVQVIKV